MRKKSKGTVSLFSSGENEEDNIPVQVPADGLDPEEQFIKEQKVDLMREVVNTSETTLQKTDRIALF